MDQQQASFEGFAIVELMGHNREIGFVTTQYFGGPALFRIDQPEIPAREYTLEKAEWRDGKQCGPGTKVQRVGLPGKTSFVGPQAVFRMTPCDEATARMALERSVNLPVLVLSLVETNRIESAAPRCQCDGCDNCYTGELGNCERSAREFSLVCVGCGAE